MLPYILSGYSIGPIRYGTTTGEARLTAEEAIMPLEHRVESLELACAGMWELLKQTTGLDDEKLVAKIKDIDVKDGRVDGKISAGVQICPACGRQSLVRNAKLCTWCGADLGRPPF